MLFSMIFVLKDTLLVELQEIATGKVVSMLPVIKIPTPSFPTQDTHSSRWHPFSWFDRSSDHSFHSCLQLLNTYFKRLCVPGPILEARETVRKKKEIYKISVFSEFVLIG